MVAKYFPVTVPYRMRAGLHQFGTDFGNGEDDQRFFPVDENYAEYIKHKRQSRAETLIIRGEEEDEVHRTVVEWMHHKLFEEQHMPACLSSTVGYESYATLLQEDFAVLHRDRIILADVRFPTGWRPERIIGESFQAIHSDVPDFAGEPKQAQAFVESMTKRGPYVRFVWAQSLSPDLDRHPDRRSPDPPPHLVQHGWLRVERQISIPFPDLEASLFLIRVYCYPIESLSRNERFQMWESIASMSPEIAAYKGIDDEQRSVWRRLLKGGM